MSSEIKKFNSFEFSAAEKAIKLFDSKGKKKGRLHLLGYEGILGHDRYAVAAKKITSENPSLGIFEKNRYILYKVTSEDNQTTWYKINKNSLQKRLGLNDMQMKGIADQKTGISTNLAAIVNTKLEQVNAWKSKITEGKKIKFIQNFIENLVKNNFSPDVYNKIFFYSSSTLFDTSIVGDHSLVILYDDTSEDMHMDFTGLASTVISVNRDDYKKITEGHPLSQSILNPLNRDLAEFNAG